MIFLHEIFLYHETLYEVSRLLSIQKFLNNELLVKVGNIMQKLRPDMNIGGNIQKIRYSRKLTQDQVIAKMNLKGIQISKSTYAKLETNRMNIKVSELVAIKGTLLLSRYILKFDDKRVPCFLFEIMSYVT